MSHDPKNIYIGDTFIKTLINDIIVIVVNLIIINNLTTCDNTWNMGSSSGANKAMYINYWSDNHPLDDSNVNIACSV